jgi:hypothetical protein
MRKDEVLVLPMTFYVKIKLIVCLGDYSSTSDFFAFACYAEVLHPVPRGEILLCPVNKHIAIPVIVSETRVGGEDAILVAYSNESPDQDLLDAFEYSKNWIPCKPASALRGEVIGVFADNEIQDMVAVETWPHMAHEELQIMVSLGLLDKIQEVVILSLESEEKDNLDDGKIVKIDRWHNKKEGK